MNLQLMTFSRLVETAAAAVQGSAKQLLDLTVGSALRAILEANASIALWLQWLIVLVLQTTRAATSTGSDLDSWMADFSVTRQSAVAATGSATFSRFTDTAGALVPVGTQVRTTDGTQTFNVIEDDSNAAWSASQDGYFLAAGTSSVTVPVQAVTAGSAGNVVAGAISLIVAAISGVDTVTNPTALQNGMDAETDAALRSRFASFLASRARATPVAVGYAVTSVQQGLQYVIQENQTPDGTACMGCFVVTVDDGSGTPASALLAQVSAAIELMRPLATTYAVQAPTIYPATISLSITTAASAVHATVASVVQTALSDYVNTLPDGAMLAWSRLAQVAYGASTSVTNVTGVLLNGGTADLVPPPNGVVKVASVTVN
jgi:uncharacterized phage protein gp47/JayE